MKDKEKVDEVKLAKKYFDKTVLSGEICDIDEFFNNADEDENIVFYDSKGNIEKIQIKKYVNGEKR